ncbi:MULTISPECIES: TetR/AcrR family transcriptional regulator [unclassified Microbacterium]|uniref:TetR/AcrR family transcriptional regulator n=1 Tax=unclassified Microbacterium TaxID=2609290 RepID=UPI00386CFECA
MTTGRPRASSRATITEAACELFLERGYDGTAVGDIAARAGVSRSSFFNYFDSKAAIIWAGFDERLRRVEAALAVGGVRPALEGLAVDLEPDGLALALVHADAMGLRDELDRGAGWRQTRISRAVTARLMTDGVAPLRAEVAGAAHAGAVVAALGAWANDGPGRAPLAGRLGEALDIAAVTLA